MSCLATIAPIIPGGHDGEVLKQVSGKTCAPGRWYDGRGKKAYSHLPAYRSLGEVHARYHNAITELIDKGVQKMPFSELSAELTELEMPGHQLVGLISQIQQYVASLQKSQSS